MPLIEFTNKGLYCPKGGFYIDPWKPVERALITHAHGDHARWGNRYYLAHHDSIPIMRLRLGENSVMEGIEYGEVRDINGVRVSFHPAGHIIGSAQIRLEYKEEIWVASGDYKLEPDNVSEPWEPVKCHAFITESTFGLPIYQWEPQSKIIGQINDWWRYNSERDVCSVLLGYALGKAQRIICNVDQSIGSVYLHGAIYNIQETFLEYGVKMPDFERISGEIRKENYRKALIIAPPSAAGSAWMRRFMPYSLGVASGWMALRGTKRRKAADRGFVLSDHADWNDLNLAIKETGAERVYVTHGYTTAFSQWLREQGLKAEVVETLYEGEMADISEAPAEEEEV